MYGTEIWYLCGGNVSLLKCILNGNVVTDCYLVWYGNDCDRNMMKLVKGIVCEKAFFFSRFLSFGGIEKNCKKAPLVIVMSVPCLGLSICCLTVAWTELLIVTLIVHDILNASLIKFAPGGK